MDNKLDVDLDGDGYSSFQGDCDDVRADIYPGASEICDDLDNDCDELIDEADNSLDWSTAQKWPVDEDNDGYGSATKTIDSCFRPADYINNSDDCDDTNPSINPEGSEVCDGVDNDCDGLLDDEDNDVNANTLNTWYQDLDGDGYGAINQPIYLCMNPAGYVDNGCVVSQSLPCNHHRGAHFRVSLALVHKEFVSIRNQQLLDSIMREL